MRHFHPFYNLNNWTANRSVLYKEADPSIFAWEIRERLDKCGVCTAATLPSFGTDGQHFHRQKLSFSLLLTLIVSECSSPHFKSWAPKPSPALFALEPGLELRARSRSSEISRSRFFENLVEIFRDPRDEISSRPGSSLHQLIVKGYLLLNWFLHLHVKASSTCWFLLACRLDLLLARSKAFKKGAPAIKTWCNRKPSLLLFVIKSWKLHCPSKRRTA
uniref:Paired domain-containing protein n=1 Tax=Globodera rostochiensis TaxID=31243 RepID=A0A914H973_GLORO